MMVNEHGPRMKSLTLTLTGMADDGGAGIRQALEAIGGVSAVTVLQAPRQAKLEYDPQRLTIAQIEAALLRAGYGVEAAVAGRCEGACSGACAARRQAAATREG
jgi:copper chaperone CopZ